VNEFQSVGGDEFGMNLGNRCMLETIPSNEMMLACLHPIFNDLETLYIPWFLSGMEGIALNHSMYARCVRTCADWADENIFEITALGI